MHEVLFEWFSSSTVPIRVFCFCFVFATPYSNVMWPDCVELDHRVNSMQLLLIF